MKIGLLGKKIGMTRVYDEKGKATPVTVIEAGGNTVLQTKTQENDGYTGVQVGFDTHIRTDQYVPDCVRGPRPNGIGGH